MKKKKSVVFMLRLTNEQHEYLDTKSNALDMKMSEYIRLLITQDKISKSLKRGTNL
jgi:hypothetical protein